MLTYVSRTLTELGVENRTQVALSACELHPHGIGRP